MSEVIQLSPEQLRLLRLCTQRLHPATRGADAAQVAQAICGLQAQELAAAHLALRVRSNGLKVEDVRQAREEDRSLVLSWCMRGTLHLMSAGDLRWLLPYFGPLFIQKGGRRYRQLGLDAQTRDRAARLMCTAVRARGPLIRAELAEVLAAQDIPVAGQAIAHLVGAAALAGQLCFGPEREGKLTHVVLEDWLGGSLSEEVDSEALLAELARRYLHACGPASTADYASWAGIGLPQARAAFQALSDDLLQVSALGQTLSMLKSQAAWLDLKPETPLVHLLPRYDTYLLGYKSRNFMVAEAYARRIHPGGGQIQQSVILDGRAIGTWRNQRQRGGVSIVVEPFEPLDPALRPYLEAEVEDIGRFLGVERTLEL